MDKLLEYFENDVSSNPLLCVVCKHYLSVPPIVHNDLIGSICGRKICSKIAKSKGVCYPQESYETFLKFIDFPCINSDNGCEYLITMEEMEEHEAECEFEKFLGCPFLDTDQSQNTSVGSRMCRWSGKTPDFYDHLKNFHSNHEFHSYVKKHFDKSFRNEIFFGEIQNDLVIVRLVNGPNSNLYLKVWTGLELLGNLKYRIKFFNNEKNLLTASKFQWAESIHLDIFKSLTDETWFKIDIANMKNLFENPTYLNIRFYVNDFEIESEEEISSYSALSVYEDIKCDKCKKKFGAPVFICKNVQMHSICDSCHSDTNTCPMPSCSKQLFSYDTSQHSQGLFQALNYFMNRFVTICYICKKEVDCLSSHLYNNHKCDNELNTWYTLKPTKKLTFNFDGHVFYLSVDLIPGSPANKSIAFYVQSSETGEIKYKYEIKLRNSETMCPALSFTSFCLPYLESSCENNIPYRTLIPADLLFNFFPRIGGFKFAFNMTKL